MIEMKNFTCELILQEEGKPKIGILIEMTCGHNSYHEISLKCFNNRAVNKSDLAINLDGQRFNCDLCNGRFYFHSENIPYLLKEPQIAEFLDEESKQENTTLSKLPLP